MIETQKDHLEAIRGSPRTSTFESIVPFNVPNEINQKYTEEFITTTDTLTHVFAFELSNSSIESLILPSELPKTQLVSKLQKF